MLFDSTPKIILDAPEGEPPTWLSEALSPRADLLVLARGPDGPTLRDAVGASLPLAHPLTAATLLVTLGPETAGSALDAAAALWTEAGLDAPPRLAVADSAESLGTVAGALLDLQAAFVRDAARRNVDLLQQVAALREVTEDQNAAFAQALDILAGPEENARLIHGATAFGPGLPLAPDARVVQRLPISIHPRLIGGVSLRVETPEATILTLSIWSEELQVTLGHHRFELDPGRFVLQMPLALQDGITPKLLDLVVENGGFAPIHVETALCESPDERAVTDGPEDFALRVDLYGPKPLDARSLPIEAWEGHAVAGTDTLAAFEKKTPGNDARNWLNVARRDKLLVHPLPDATAIASLDRVPVDGVPTGVSALLQLRAQAASMVFACISVTTKALDFEDVEEAEAFATGDTAESFGEIARTDWHAVLPGTEQEIALDWTPPARGRPDLKINLMTTTRGQSTACTNFWFRNLAFLYKS